ncbi:MAG: thioredoxin [Planctomycetota bacterium]|jgi:thioredoxin 1|nr:thioredoxin [Planctomycetota bacterium]
MSEHVREITDEDFPAATAKGVTLVDFWAPWCGPCMRMGPVLEAVAQAEANVKVCKVNVDEQQARAAEFGINSIPALLVFKDGKLAKQLVGYHDQAALTAELRAV